MEKIHYIQEIMDRQGVSISELALRMNVAQSSVSVQLTNDLRLSKAKRIADALNVPFYRLFIDPDSDILSECVAKTAPVEPESPETKEAFCKQLKAMRENRHMTVNELSCQLKCNQTSVNRIESGFITTRLNMALRYLQYFGKNMVLCDPHIRTVVKDAVQIPAWLTSIREKRKINTPEMARIAGVSPVSLRAVEQSKANITLDTLFKIATAFEWHIIIE